MYDIVSALYTSAKKERERIIFNVIDTIYEVLKRKGYPVRRNDVGRYILKDLQKHLRFVSNFIMIVPYLPKGTKIFVIDGVYLTSPLKLVDEDGNLIANIDEAYVDFMGKSRIGDYELTEVFRSFRKEVENYLKKTFSGRKIIFREKPITIMFSQVLDIASVARNLRDFSQRLKELPGSSARYEIYIIPKGGTKDDAVFFSYNPIFGKGYVKDGEYGSKAYHDFEFDEAVSLIKDLLAIKEG